MIKKHKILGFLWLFLSISFHPVSLADEVSNKTSSTQENTSNATLADQITEKEQSALQERFEAEKAAKASRYIVKTYRPNYILPFYYTGSPDFEIYEGRIPDNQKLEHTEFKGQLSLRMTLWDHMFDSNYSLQAGYTQVAYWQLYTKSAWFRETNYEPEIFITTQPLKHWLVNVGLNHQSNGQGGDFERSWNRAFIDVATSGERWTIAARVWMVIFREQASDIYNPHIANFLGHTKFLGAYKIGENVLTASVRNIERFEHAAYELTWSHPITHNLSAYVQGFAGYGQSMIEYDHYTNNVGVGLALNDWI